MRASIVVDLGFGDAGKGTITDALVRRTEATWVLRYNGGAQAGHNVVTNDGRHHTLSQFGAGTFVPAVHTYLTPKVVVHPSALLFEERHLQAVGVCDGFDRLHVASTCRVTTPYHQAAGRIRELARGDGAHGTCGVGVGETVRDILEHPDDVLRMSDLLQCEEHLHKKLERIRRRLANAIATLPRTASTTDEDTVLQTADASVRWLELISPMRSRLLVEDDAVFGPSLEKQQDLVFEGAQGVLLDEWQGFHPHTTWSTCTSQWAEEWLAVHRLPHEIHRLGVLRVYPTRHGNGPFPSAATELQESLAEPHNEEAGWQGQFRRGWPDPALLRYAISANGGIDALALTHLDRISAVKRWQYIRSHGTQLPVALPGNRDLERQRNYGTALEQSAARFTAMPTMSSDEWIAWYEAELGAPIEIASHGPRPSDKRFRA